MKSLSSVSLGGQSFALEYEVCASEQFKYPFVIIDGVPVFNIEVSYGKVNTNEIKRCAKLLESYYKYNKEYLVEDRRKKAKYPLQYDLMHLDLDLYSVSVINIIDNYRVSLSPIDIESELPVFTVLNYDLARYFLLKNEVTYDPDKDNENFYLLPVETKKSKREV